MRITKVELVSNENGDPLPAVCTEGDVLTGYFKFYIDQNAGTRYGMLVTADIYVDDQLAGTVAGCNSESFSKPERQEFVLTTAGTVTWTCGAKVELKNIFIGWGNSSSQNVCDIDPCKIGPQCVKYSLSQSFTVQTPLSADFDYSGTCPGGTTAERVLFDALADPPNGTTGGSPSPTYTGFSWTILNPDGSTLYTTSGTSSFTYQFNTAGTYTVTLVVTDDNPTATSSVSKSVIVGSCCVPSTVPTGATASNTTQCAGNTNTITVSGGSLGTGASWKWYAGGCGPDDGGTLAGSGASINVMPTSTTTYYVRAEGQCGTTTCQQVTVTVYDPANAGTIGGEQTICYNTTATVEVTNPTGTIIGWQSSANGSTGWTDVPNSAQNPFTTGSLTATTYFRAVAQNGAGCATATSDAVKINVTAASYAGAIGGEQTICYNTSATVSVDGAVGTVTTWQSSPSGSAPWSNVSGSAGQNPFTTGNLTATTWFRAVVQNGAGCATATSDPVNINVRAASYAGAIGGEQTICYNTSATVSVDGAVGTVTTWQSSPNGSAPWSSVSGSAGQNPFTTGNLTATTWFRAVVQNGAGCATATSDPVNINVRAASYAGAIGGEQTICYNTSATVSVDGAVGTVTTWQSSPNGSAPWSSVSGSAGQNPFTTGNLTATTWFRAVVQNGAGCATATSDPVKINVRAASNAGTIGGEQTICYNTTATVEVTNPTGTIIGWQSSANGSTGWTEIPNSAQNPFTTGSLTATTYFRAVAQNGAGCATATSGAVKINVRAASHAGAIGGEQTICYNTTATVEVTNPTGTIIGWQSSANGSTGWTDVPNSAQNPFTTGSLTATTYFRAVAQNGAGCATATSGAVKINVRAASNAGTIGGEQTICYNTTATVEVTNPTGTIIGWQSSANGSTGWTHVPNSAQNPFTTGSLSATTYFRAVAQNGAGCATATSDPVKINVRAASYAGAIGGEQTICYNTTATVEVTNPTGTIIGWQSSANGSTGWTDVPNSAQNPFTTGSLTATTYFRAVAQNGAGCATATSDPVKINVRAASYAGAIGGEQTICYNTTATVEVTNPTGTIIGWQSSANGSTGWTDVPNSAQNPFTTGSLSATTYFRAVAQNGAGCATATSDPVKINVSRNSICGEYTAEQFVNTNTTSSGGTATFTLEFTITGDGTNDCHSLVDLQAGDFEIVKVASDPTNTIVNIGAATYSITTGKVSALATVTLPNNVYSATVTFRLNLLNTTAFVFGECTEDALVTISTKVDGFVTGGGYVTQPTTCGDYGGNPNIGYKNNFGFNVKYNKGGKNLQGSWTSVFRRMEGGAVHTYQLKSNSPNKLDVYQVSATSYRAVIRFTGGNLKDLTNNNSTVASALTINVVVWDNGEPGGGVDGIYYEVLNGSTLLYQSDCSGSTATTTSLNNLVKGNIQIHVLGGKNARMDNAVTEVLNLNKFELSAYPNPSRSYFKVQVQSDNTRDAIQLRVVDLLGRTVETKNNVTPNSNVQLGANYKTGVYMVEVSQGELRRQLKVIKQ